jgi:hypothetical protein
MNIKQRLEDEFRTLEAAEAKRAERNDQGIFAGYEQQMIKRHMEELEQEWKPEEGLVGILGFTLPQPLQESEARKLSELVAAFIAGYLEERGETLPT